MMLPTITSSAGMANSSKVDKPASSRMARKVPPIAVMGAAMSSVQVMKTIIWTCCTSLVIRVISDDAPSWLTSRLENPVTPWNRSLRTSRPNPIEARDP